MPIIRANVHRETELHTDQGSWYRWLGPAPLWYLLQWRGRPAERPAQYRLHTTALFLLANEFGWLLTI
jgi:hypothetical protein